jgi:hypothetical protein
VIEYLLSFETRLPGSAWRATHRIASADSDILDQYATLKRWAETGEEPVRHVTLKQREVVVGEWRTSSC